MQPDNEKPKGHMIQNENREDDPAVEKNDDGTLNLTKEENNNDSQTPDLQSKPDTDKK